MRTIRSGVWLGLGLVCFLTSLAAQPQQLSGEWNLQTRMYGVAESNRLHVVQVDNALSGYVYEYGERVAISGRVSGSKLVFSISQDWGLESFTGEVQSDALSGGVEVKGKRPASGDWTAERIVTRTRPAQTFEFDPTQFHSELSSTVPPALHIFPGDSVHTRSIDAGGQDEAGARVAYGSNPLTGPFYVEGAMPGDVLAVTIKRLRLNRDWATSDEALISKVLTSGYTSEHRQNWAATRWHLDREHNVATLEDAPPELKTFSVPLRPMLGGIGVAPEAGQPPLSTQDSGDLGGNLDCNQITEGSTVYLPVFQPGALLYLGDAHALQGDGELNGNALETSMDIEFSVDVQREKDIGGPRVENHDYIMAIGLAGSLDAAIRLATSDLARWIENDYKLTGPGVAAVLGTSTEYSISEMPDRNVGIVAKLRKQALALIHPMPRRIDKSMRDTPGQSATSSLVRETGSW